MSEKETLTSEERDHEQNLRLRLMMRLYKGLEQMAGEVLASEEHKKDHWFHYPSDPLEFIEQLTLARQYLTDRSPTYLPKIKFIDVGCGIGTKVAIASTVCHLHAFGLEINQEYVDFAKRWYNNTRAGDPDHLIQGDCLTFDRYHEFDIIYWYPPLFRKSFSLDGNNAHLNRQVDEAIYRGAKVGAVLYRYGGSYGDVPTDVRIASVPNQRFVVKVA